jgi:hypothetical protein
MIWMQLINKSSRTLILILGLFAGMAWGALPDPVEFAWIVERGDIKRVTTWLDEGLDPEFQGSQIGSGLMIAAWHGNIPMMALFVERGANPRRANKNGEQALQLAAWNGHMEALKWLLEHGAVLNREGNYWGALHYAVFNGHLELARDLIGRGAEVNARSPNGSTPLMLAAREGREELAKVLLESGADTKAKNDWGDSALTMAMRYDHYQLGKMISSVEEFAVAVKAPKESFGEPVRSASAPSEIEELLRKIREAEAEGRSSDELRKQLMEAVNAFRRNAIVQQNARRPMPLPYQPRSIVITAKRGKPGAEKAQVVVGAHPARPSAAAKPGSKAGAGSITVTPGKPRVTPGQIAELMRQIRLTEAQGQPADELRRQLYEAVELMKQQ